ncbi:MAG: sigma-70 family RNA polymerase sigma factor [Planctomycetota bacterium]
MIATRLDGVSVGRTKQSKRSLQKARVEKLLKTEVAFIANKAFSKIKPGKEKPDSELVEQVIATDDIPLPNFAAGLPAHLARMCATPLLAHEDEREFFRWMNYYKFRANALRSRLQNKPELADDIEECLRTAERLRNYLVQANTRLVLSIARKFADARNAFDDLLSQGVVSLMHAVEKFDFDRGYRFSTYATCAVRRDLYRQVMGRKKDLQRFSTGNAEHLDACTDTRAPLDPNAEADWKTLSTAIGEMLEQLDERERFIVRKRYGLEGSGKKESYSMLGRELGISKERVRQLANRAMEKLRDKASDRRLDVLLA